MTPCVVFAGGGSGGHLSPGLAIAERLQSLNPEVRCRFYCSNREIDRTMLLGAGADFQPVPAAPFSLRPGGLIRFMRGLNRGTRCAVQSLRSDQVSLVLALGGFVSAPVVRAARKAKVSSILLNLDAVPGHANKWVARHCDEVLSAIPLQPGISLANLSGTTNFPIRRIARAPGDAASCRERLGLVSNRPTLLVTGASQGASTLNGFMRQFVLSATDSFEGWQVLHLSGGQEKETLERAYASAGIQATVIDFLEHMGLAWGAADLAISRAGANSVAEVAANRVPAIFVPYPWHKDLHQRFNAQELVDGGAACLVEDAIDPMANMASLGVLLQRLLLDGSARHEMSLKLEKAAKNDGASEIAALIYARVLGGDRSVS
jgi:UDP-N-acetylglucosamine--N-acetylmuramyl-(pentapeptide) pyrophosphoryl-undecaprenol N-acetylglucosamine transferase